MNREERRKLNKISSSGKINISKYIFHKLFFSNLSDLYKIVSWIEENPKIHNRFDKAVLHKSMSDFNKIKYRINKKQNTNISFYMTYLIVFLYRSYLSDSIKLKSQYEKNFFPVIIRNVWIFLMKLKKNLVILYGGLVRNLRL